MEQDLQPTLLKQLDKAIIKRVYLETETLGSWFYKDELLCKTMELPWKNNESNISCISEGIYVVRKNPPKETRPYNYFRFDFVKGRNHNPDGKSRILIHKITYVKDLLGCVGVGLEFKDFNKDGVPDMADSTKALEKLIELMPEEFELEISSKSGVPYK